VACRAVFLSVSGKLDDIGEWRPGREAQAGGSPPQRTIATQRGQGRDRAGVKTR
jgi:hypothetical protein